MPGELLQAAHGGVKVNDKDEDELLLCPMPGIV